MSPGGVALVVAVVASSALLRCDALYFMVTEGVTRCFLEDVPEDTLVVGKYKNFDAGIAVGQTQGTVESVPGIEIYVEEPTQGAEIYSGKADREGRFVFTSHDGGEHKICLSVSSSNWFGMSRKFKFELHLDVGESAVDYNEMAKVEHLTAIEVEIRKLTDMVRGIRSEQSYQRARERAFRDTSESTNSRVMWWSIAQTVFVVVTGVWQVFYLKSFFKKKKLV
ncbi:GOLD domain-containing protein [Plasmodiophora brassicae]|uniref:GOLD domain-containing protein n=1 Tax=Plasmodiophora brassicae TaxID=37360 RepID=A0A3P3Y0P7_PLABS|nr:unnamed protein product [Plasmodiophora brassicae]